MPFTRQLASVVAVAVFSFAQADIINVGPGDSIQDAIDAAMDGDEIVVAPGTYFETIDFLGKAITLYSSDGPDVTIIDAQQTGSVVTCESGEGTDTVLEGFTVTGGSHHTGGGMRNVNTNATVINCTFAANHAETLCCCGPEGECSPGRGGGMHNYVSSPLVINCDFVENTAGAGFNNRGPSGGGMYNFDSNPTVINCSFIGNTAPSGQGIGAQGGGIHNAGSSPIVIGCTFSGNRFGSGSGMFNSGGNPVIIDCKFSENEGGGGGGAAMYNTGSSPTVTNCTFEWNSASHGGAIANFKGGNPTLTNCSFIGNTASSGSGGAMHNQASNPTVTNCTFSRNTARSGGGAMVNFPTNNVPSNPHLTNSVLWDNSPDQICDFESAATVNYTDVQGGYPGIGNIDADPMFVDPDNGDFRLSPGSPCIDAGNNWGVSPDFGDLDSDHDTLELTPWDLDGNPRFVGDGNDFDPGCGEPVVVDMGAYERPGASFSVVFGDLNGNGTVGVVDLMILRECMGSGDPDCCVADLDLDGAVGMSDVMLLIPRLVHSVPFGL